MLDRSKFSAFIVPSAAKTPKASIDFYSKASKEKYKQPVVFIFPDFNTCAAVFRSGSFNVNFKYILCAPASKLEEHGLEPIDATFKGAIWQVKQTMSATVNSSLAKAVMDDRTIDKLSKKVERIEHQFSNPKAVDQHKIIDVRQAFALLGDKDSPQSQTALLKFLVYGFVAKEASRLGSTPDEIIDMASKSLRVKNKTAFTAFVKAKKIPMTAAAAKAIYDLQQNTRTAKYALRFAWKAIVGSRPACLASAETACDPSLGALMTRFLKETDFPVTLSERKSPEINPVHNATCTIVSIKRGWHDMIELITTAGYRGKDDTDLLAKSGHPVKFSKSPLWRDNKAWWPVGMDTNKPLMMLFANRKFRFEALPK